MHLGNPESKSAKRERPSDGVLEASGGSMDLELEVWSPGVVLLLTYLCNSD